MGTSRPSALRSSHSWGGSIRRLVALVASAVFVAAGCAQAADDACPVGTEGCECTLGGACDPGLLCLSSFCVDPDGAGGGGAHATSTTSSKAASTTGVTTAAGTTSAGPTTGVTSASATTGGGVTTAATTTSGGTCSVPDPAVVMGCTTCGPCDTWTASWSPVMGATHYRVKFLCGGGTHESPNIVDTSAELCYQATMCAYCSNGLAGMWIEACDGTCCSAGAPVPEAEAPLGCQVDCCL